MIPDDWVPTPDAVNALPESLRRYVHDLETRCDPAGMVWRLAELRQRCAMLERALGRERTSTGGYVENDQSPIGGILAHHPRLEYHPGDVVALEWSGVSDGMPDRATVVFATPIQVLLRGKEETFPIPRDLGVVRSGSFSIRLLGIVEQSRPKMLDNEALQAELARFGALMKEARAVDLLGLRRALQAELDTAKRCWDMGKPLYMESHAGTVEVIEMLLKARGRWSRLQHWVQQRTMERVNEALQEPSSAIGPEEE